MGFLLSAFASRIAHDSGGWSPLPARQPGDVEACQRVEQEIVAAFD
jgi:hypothetical protein